MTDKKKQKKGLSWGEVLVIGSIVMVGLAIYFGPPLG